MSDPRQDRRFQEVVRWIEQQLHTGALRPGDRLPPERRLVEQFGISRTVVREALQALGARGLIESHVGRGTFVRLPSTHHLAKKLNLLDGAEVSNVPETLQMLVRSLAELASERRANEQLRRLQVLAAEVGEGPDVLDEFLRVLAQAAHNPLLGTITRALAAILYERGHQQPSVDARAVVACLERRRNDSTPSLASKTA